MNVEKILERTDGSKVKITVSVTIDWSDSLPRWNFYVHTLAPKKKKWTCPHSTNDYTWRGLDRINRRIYEENKYYQFVTKAEVQDVKLELWNKIKPTIEE